jgi:hypothetical protein
MTADYYAALHVAPDAPPEVIRAAYRTLIQRRHPDKSSGLDSQAAVLNEAYRVLSNPTERCAYDAARQGRAARPETPRQPGAAPSRRVVSGQAAGQAFTLTFEPGRVIASRTWTEIHTITDRRGSRTQAGERQRIGIRTADRDVFVEAGYGLFPLEPGARVELIAAARRGADTGHYVALCDREAGHWHWLVRPLRAAQQVCPWWVRAWGLAKFLLFFPAVVAGWLLLKPFHLPWLLAAYILLGVPYLLFRFVGWWESISFQVVGSMTRLIRTSSP